MVSYKNYIIKPKKKTPDLEPPLKVEESGVAVSRGDLLPYEWKAWVAFNVGSRGAPWIRSVLDRCGPGIRVVR